MDYQTRLELDALSNDVYGNASRWRKLLASGTKKLILQGEGKTKNVRIYEVINHTYESIKQHMLDLKASREAAKKKFEDEQTLRNQAASSLDS